MAPVRNVQTAEVAVFLLLIVPSTVLSLFVKQGQLSFSIAATAVIFRDVGLVSLILFFLWRNGEPVSRLGWTGRHAAREAIIGVICFVPVFLGAALLDRILLRAGLSGPTTPLPSFLNDKGPAGELLGVVLVMVVAVAEETMFRGYLLLRFLPILGSTTASVLLSSAIFALGHGYEGSSGIVTVGAMGAAFALVYLWRRSLAAPIVMHFLQDFLSVVILPALGPG